MGSVGLPSLWKSIVRGSRYGNQAIVKDATGACYSSDSSRHMEAAKVEGVVDHANNPDGEAVKSTLEYLVNMEIVLMEDDSISDESNIETRARFQEDVESLLQMSADFDPKFKPEQAPRIALLCQTCHTALQTATRLAQSERQRQKLALGGLRVRIWGTDIFDATKSTPLDELLSSGTGHTSLRRHLIGVWADMAATLELILSLLIHQTGKPSPESCTQWRRLRVVLGLDDISTAIHGGFNLSGVFDNDITYGDHTGVLDCLISSLEELIDCLFDLLVTIGTIRQLHRLGYEFTYPGSSSFCTVEDKAGESNKKSAENSQAPSFPADGVSSYPAPLATGSKMSHEMSSQCLEGGLGDNESCRISKSAIQDVPKGRSDGMANASNLAVHDGPTESQTESTAQEGSPETSKTPESANIVVDEVETAVEASSQASSANTRRLQKPIKFIDCYARTFALPFELCCTWEVGVNSLHTVIDSSDELLGYTKSHQRIVQKHNGPLCRCYQKIYRAGKVRSCKLF